MPKMLYLIKVVAGKAENWKLKNTRGVFKIVRNPEWLFLNIPECGGA